MPRGIRHTIEEMKELSRGKGGKCISEKYSSIHGKLRWECDKGHIWEAIPASIIWHNSWCPICRYSSEGHGGLMMEDMHKLAKKRGGKCLSKNYISVRRNLKWQCRNGHIFEALPETVATKSSKNWCPICIKKFFHNRLRVINEMQKLIVSKGGIYISEYFVGGGGKFRLQCKIGHIFEATYSQLKKEYWCPYCEAKKYFKK